jgi:hypothetical protein
MPTTRSSGRSTVAAVGIDPLKARVRQVFLFELFGRGRRDARGYACSASMKGVPAVGTVKDVAAGKRAIRRLYCRTMTAA